MIPSPIDRGVIREKPNINFIAFHSEILDFSSAVLSVKASAQMCVTMAMKSTRTSTKFDQ